ncbi:MAG: hypothetical protein BWY99_01181 [Synergistetes bacterium ADurb.BinA166]|nr:MAG: hypothetical protein BWY99_01181 [Synergistetes bacterium ADurb.BinA166]
MGDAIRGSGSDFPRWMKAASIGMGVLLFGDGLRRFLTGAGLAEASAFIIIGSACFYIAGYEKRVSLAESGFVRERLFWGKGRVERLAWSEMEEVVLFQSKSGTMVLFPLKDRGWRAFFPGKTGTEIRKFVEKHGGGVPVKIGEGTSVPARHHSNER